MQEHVISNGETRERDVNDDQRPVAQHWRETIQAERDAMTRHQVANMIIVISSPS